jgi:S1-C subfamily serine protease
VIIKFDGKDIKASRDLPRIVADTPVGKDVEVHRAARRQGSVEDGQARPA